MAERSTTQDLSGPLVREVVALCRKGLRNTDLPATPHLRELLGVPESLPGPQALPVLRASIVDAASTLPPKLCLVFYASAGVKAGSPSGRLERLAEAAAEGGISERTARRWSEETAPPQIVARLLSSTKRAALGARFEMLGLYTRLDLSMPTPVVSHQRDIRVLAPRMDGFYEEVTVPGLTEKAPVFRGLQGCRLGTITGMGPNMWGINYSFPESRWAMERHSFSTSMVLPDHASLRPELGFRPHNTTLNATVEILFGSQLPARIETFQTTSVTGFVPPAHVVQTLIPDGRRQRFEFREIQLGFAVGVRWFMAD